MSCPLRLASLVGPLAAAHLLGLALLAGCGDSAGGSDGSGGGGGNGSPSVSAQSGSENGSGGSTAGDGEPAGMVGMTAAHNLARADVSPSSATPIPGLEWDPEIAAIAQAYAERCVFEHSGANGLGENLYANAGSLATPQDVVKSWDDEAVDYDYATNTCNAGAICGHYTQVVWAESQRLGCGYARCTANTPFDGFETWDNWVCNYDPPGNWVGEKPY